MTENTVAPDPEAEGWNEGQEPAAGAAFPEYPANPHNHRYTVSVSGNAPMIVVRGNTASEVKEAFDELEAEGLGAVIGAFQAGVKAAYNMAQQLGATVAPAGPQGAPQAQFPAPPAQQFPQAAQQFPGQPGQAPAPWQNAGAPAFHAPQPNVPQNWYKLNVPFGPQKNAFDAIVAQYSFRKGDPGKGGQVSFQKEPVKSWFCSPDVVGAFTQFSPTSAHA